MIRRFLYQYIFYRSYFYLNFLGYEVNAVNSTCTFYLGGAFSNAEFLTIARNGVNSIYDPRKFHAIIIRARVSPQITVTMLVFKNGKVIMTGARRMEQCVRAAYRLSRQVNSILCATNFQVSELNLRNVVYSGGTKHRVKIDNLSKFLRDNKWYKCTYDPTIFPGVRVKSPMFTATIFASGKFILSGLQSFAVDRKIFQYLFDILSNFIIY